MGRFLDRRHTRVTEIEGGIPTCGTNTSSKPSLPAAVRRFFRVEAMAAAPAMASTLKSDMGVVTYMSSEFCRLSRVRGIVVA